MTPNDLQLPKAVPIFTGGNPSGVTPWMNNAKFNVFANAAPYNPLPFTDRVTVPEPIAGKPDGGVAVMPSSESGDASSPVADSTASSFV